MSRFPRPAICLVTDRRRLAPAARTTDDALRHLEMFLAEAVDAGVDLIQVRERDLPSARLVHIARTLVRLSRGTSTAVLINDRTDVAVAAQADGVHIRADGPPTERIRPLVGGGLVGRSIHPGDEIASSGVDYFMFGTVFDTVSKPAMRAGAGLDALRIAVARSSVPVLAIGGMTPERAAACRRRGAAGVAAIGLFLPEGTAAGSLGVRRAVSELRAAMLE